MREPVADGYVAACPGTEMYRTVNAFEAAIVAIALDQFGFHREAAEGYRLSLEMQEDDGEWADPKGWGHFMWGNSGFKSWAAMEHCRWIPGAPGKTSGSRWGVLNALFPCRLLPADHELIAGTLRHIESHVSEGGIPVHTGWMQDGMWVAITLDNIAEAQLCRGNGDAAARYLYATLNHGTPLHTWCEERGQEPGTAKTSGDRQHLWTPVAVVRLVRRLLVMEDGNGLHLARGAARQWLASGRPVGIVDAPTHFGEISYEVQHDAASHNVSAAVVFPERETMQWAVLHVRLPHGLTIESVNAESGATVLPDGSGVRWEHPRGEAKVVATLGPAGRAPAAAVSPRVPTYPGLLDVLREKVHCWTESLWDPARGGFRQNAAIGVNLMSTTDVAWMRYAVNDPDLCGDHRNAWVRWLQQAQDPQTGEVRYDPRDGGLIHSNGHGLWHTVRALNILGGQLLHFPHHLRSATSVEGLQAWFDAVDWDNSSPGAHHEVLGLIPLLANLNDPAWTDAFYRKIAEQQDTDSGGFPRGKMNVSRTFAYASIHLATGRRPPRAERIVDSMLAAQKANGFWENEPGFHTMDAAYVLVRLPSILHHGQTQATRALERLASGLVDYYRDNEDRVHQSTHGVLAIVHAFGLLQEAFPDQFPSERPYRFDWDKPEMCRCDAISPADDSVGRPARGSESGGDTG